MLQGCAVAADTNQNLKIDFQCELKRPRIVGCCGLPRRACSRNWVAKRVDVARIEAVQHVESIRDDLQVDAFRDRNRARNTQVNLEKSRARKRIASERAGAAEEWRRNIGKRKRRAVAADAAVWGNKREALDER